MSAAPFAYRAVQQEPLRSSRIPPIRETSTLDASPGRAVPTNQVVTRRDGVTLRWWSDGSLRRMHA